jgi:ABC-type transport system involved in cytochrome bd biosynthesis fused ATPase/permease subunit
MVSYSPGLDGFFTCFLKSVDRVFLLCENRLEAIGAHEELMSQNPNYASLVIGAV